MGLSELEPYRNLMVRMCLLKQINMLFRQYKSLVIKKEGSELSIGSAAITVRDKENPFGSNIPNGTYIY